MGRPGRATSVERARRTPFAGLRLAVAGRFRARRGRGRARDVPSALARRPSGSGPHGPRRARRPDGPRVRRPPPPAAPNAPLASRLARERVSAPALDSATPQRASDRCPLAPVPPRMRRPLDRCAGLGSPTSARCSRPRSRRDRTRRWRCGARRDRGARAQVSARRPRAGARGHRRASARLARPHDEARARVARFRERFPDSLLLPALESSVGEPRRDKMRAARPRTSRGRRAVSGRQDRRCGVWRSGSRSVSLRRRSRDAAATRWTSARTTPDPRGRRTRSPARTRSPTRAPRRNQVWTGHLVNHQFTDGSDALTMTLDFAADGRSPGRCSLATAPLLQPPTDPNVGYPPGNLGRSSASSKDSPTRFSMEP